MIPYGKQSINQQDIDAVVEVLQSSFITQGPVLTKFEEAIANYCHARYGVATANATAALHIACLALGVGKGDRVWTSPISFVASANCALYCGADIDFVDIDVNTANMSVSELERKLEAAQQCGQLPKVVIPVHMGGQSCDMKAIKALAQRYGFKIIEDASHAIGGRYNQKPVGNCEYSDITVFSFHPVKIITSAEGGMALTNDAALSATMQQLRSHGISRDREQFHTQAPGDWVYEQHQLGFNYRMTEMQAALGLSQLSRLDQFVSQRHQKADYYLERIDALSQPGFQAVMQRPNTHSAYHLFIILLDDEYLPHKTTIFAGMRNKGIGVNLHYIPIYQHPFYRQNGFANLSMPQAECYYQKAISLPLFPELSDKQQDYIIQSLAEILQEIP